MEAAWRPADDPHRAPPVGGGPVAARRGHPGGRVVRFAVDRCALGALLVATTPRGVCAILLGDEGDALAEDLRRRFPAADLLRDDAAEAATVAAVAALVDAPAAGLSLPLDSGGTGFQAQVWAALRLIPAGRTATYDEVAAAIGRPGAARAVAGACAANPLAIAIPCHRVVRKDGGLSGYRWGVDRKRALLARETAAIAGPAPAG